VEGVVNAAVGLKGELSREQATIYYCYFVKHEVLFDENSMDLEVVKGGTRQGKVRMCLSPGLARLDEQGKQVTVLKARTRL